MYKNLAELVFVKSELYLYSAVQCSAVQCSAVQCSAVQCTVENYLGFHSADLCVQYRGGILWPLRGLSGTVYYNTLIYTVFTVYPHVRLSVCLRHQVHFQSRPSVRVSVCLSVFTFEVPFKRLFAPTSQSRMSNIFRESESFGKRNGKKWSQIWTFFVWKWSKIAAQKKSFFCCWFYLTKHGRNHIFRWIRDFWSKGVSLILAYL